MRKALAAFLLIGASALRAEPYLVLDIAAEAGDGEIVIDLNSEGAPQHVERIVALAGEGAYDNIAFHRVIDGFMAQTGDVEFGKMDGDLSRAGMGGSSYDDLPAEFSDAPFEKGVVGMARAQHPDSANSQFFIMLAPGRFLDGQYTVIGSVVEGQEVVDRIKKGNQALNGAIEGTPDAIRSASVKETLE